MDHDPQDRISQIPEIQENRWLLGLRSFVAAWGWGLMAGTSALVGGGGSLLMNPGTLDLYELAMFTFSMSVFVAIFTLAGMLIVGLPLTFLLRALGKEHAAVYALVGIVAGFMIIVAISGFPRHASWADLIVLAAGAFAGLAAAYRWGRWRQSRSAARQRLVAEKRTNPIHDLIH